MDLAAARKWLGDLNTKRVLSANTSNGSNRISGTKAIVCDGCCRSSSLPHRVVSVVVFLAFWTSFPDLWGVPAAIRICLFFFGPFRVSPLISSHLVVIYDVAFIIPPSYYNPIVVLEPG